MCLTECNAPKVHPCCPQRQDFRREKHCMTSLACGIQKKPNSEKQRVQWWFPGMGQGKWGGAGPKAQTSSPTVNRFWGSNIRHGDHSQHCFMHLEVVESIHLTCSPRQLCDRTEVLPKAMAVTTLQYRNVSDQQAARLKLTQRHVHYISVKLEEKGTRFCIRLPLGPCLHL